MEGSLSRRPGEVLPAVLPSPSGIPARERHAVWGRGGEGIFPVRILGYARHAAGVQVATDLNHLEGRRMLSHQHHALDARGAVPRIVPATAIAVATMRRCMQRTACRVISSARAARRAPLPKLLRVSEKKIRPPSESF